MTRQLVTIRQVTEVAPIEGADFIELAKVDGWQCIVKKGDFEVGFFGVYHEIDSLLPLSNPAYAFLQRSGATKTHHRLKTIKMKGTLSQGLLLPLNADGLEVARSWFTNGPETEVPDLAAEMGVTLYEPEIHGVGGATGVCLRTFPGFLPRTDLERCQNIKRDIELTIANNIGSPEPETFEVQTKYDGTSLTAYCRPDVFVCAYEMSEIGVCSRNQQLKDDGANMYWRGALDAGWLYALPIIAEACGGTVAIQGELMGPGIQSNRMKLIAKQAFAFDIFSVKHARYLTRTERDLMWDLVEFKSGVRIVEVDTMAACWALTPLSDILIDFMAHCEKLVGYPLEGLVYKSNRPGGLRFKAISNSYLLKFGE